MNRTIKIPDATYQKIKEKKKQTGISIKHLVAVACEESLHNKNKKRRVKKLI